jgi:NhaP-type Na+/H+ or K+/H+ antiporter
VLSIPLFLPNGDAFPGRYELVFLATGVILFSLLVGVILLPVLLRGVGGVDKSSDRREIQQARAMMAGVAIESLYKMGRAPDA